MSECCSKHGAELKQIDENSLQLFFKKPNFWNKTTKLDTFFGKMKKRTNEHFQVGILLYHAIGRFCVRKPECYTNNFPSIYETWLENTKSLIQYAVFL